jgi:hypothetical protein
MHALPVDSGARSCWRSNARSWPTAWSNSRGREPSSCQTSLCACCHVASRGLSRCCAACSEVHTRWCEPRCCATMLLSAGPSARAHARRPARSSRRSRSHSSSLCAASGLQSSSGRSAPCHLYVGVCFAHAVVKWALGRPQTHGRRLCRRRRGGRAGGGWQGRLRRQKGARAQLRPFTDARSLSASMLRQLRLASFPRALLLELKDALPSVSLHHRHFSHVLGVVFAYKRRGGPSACNAKRTLRRQVLSWLLRACRGAGERRVPAGRVSWQARLAVRVPSAERAVERETTMTAIRVLQA